MISHNHRQPNLQQTHLLRNTFKYAPRQHWDKIAKDLRPVYTAVDEADARVRFEEFAEKWCDRYPAIRQL